MRIPIRLMVGALLALLGLTALPAAAQQSDWKNTVVAYGWLTLIDGSYKVGPREGPVDVEASDVLTQLQIAGMGRYRGETNRWSVVGDIVFASVGASKDSQLTRTHVDLNLLIAEGNFGYKLWPQSEVYVGARWARFGTKVDVHGPLRDRRFDGDIDLVAPVVGLRTIRDLNEKWRLQAEGDVGGGGGGFTFTAAGMVNVGYRQSEVISWWGGLRADYFDFDKVGAHDAVSAEVTFWGPQAGVAFTF